MPAAGIIGAVATVGSAVVGANAAKKATAAQVSAAKDQIELDKAIYEDQKNMFAPYRESGTKYQQALDYELGIGDRPVYDRTPLTVTKVPGTRIDSSNQGLYGDGGQFSGVLGLLGVRNNKGQTVADTWQVGDKFFKTEAEANDYANKNATGGRAYEGYKATDSYKFRRSQGIEAVDNSAASSGMLFSGQTLKDQMTYADGLAAAEQDAYLDRITQAAHQGQSAAANTSNAAQNMGTNIGDAYANIGNAQSQGAMARAGAYQKGIENFLTYGGQQGWIKTTPTA